MSEAKDLVPPLDLCKQIPAGAFADSALIWFIWEHNGKLSGNVVEREMKDQFANALPMLLAVLHKELPAPTLPEIMLALDEAGYFSPTCYRKANTWCVDCEDDPVDEEASSQPCLYDAEDNYNSATAALKLWLDLEGGK